MFQRELLRLQEKTVELAFVTKANCKKPLKNMGLPSITRSCQITVMFCSKYRRLPSDPTHTWDLCGIDLEQEQIDKICSEWIDKAKMLLKSEAEHGK